MSRSASYTPRLRAVSRLRGRRGLAGGDCARISAVVRSSPYTSSVRSGGRFEGREGFPSSGFFFGMSVKIGNPLDARWSGGEVSVLPRRPGMAPRNDGPKVRQYSGGVAQLGERVNGIHEVRGSIPLASTPLGSGGLGAMAVLGR